MWESIPSSAVWQLAGVYSGRRQPTELLLLLLLFFANVSRSGSIVVVGDPIFANVSGFGVVVVLGDRLRGHHFTEARAPIWAKVIKLRRREH